MGGIREVVPAAPPFNGEVTLTNDVFAHEADKTPEVIVGVPVEMGVNYINSGATLMWARLKH